MDSRGGFAFRRASPDGTNIVIQGDTAVRLALFKNVAEAREIGVPQFGIRPQRIIGPALRAWVDVEQMIFCGHFVAAENDGVDAADELIFEQPLELERRQTIAENGRCFREGAVVSALAGDGRGVFRKDMRADARE